MGIRDVLADFLSSEGSHDRAGRDDAESGGSDSSSGDAQGGEDDAGPPESSFDVELEELDQEEQVEALEGRLDEMEGSMQQNRSELETIKGSQQDVAEQLNEVNDTVRQLLGIYDQLTADVNPFMDGPTRDADPDAEGFGVVGGEEPDPESEVVEAVVEGDADPGEDAEAADGDEADEGEEDEEATTIGLEDLRAEYEAEAADEGEEAVIGDDAAEAAVGQEDEPADNEIEVEPTTVEESMSRTGRPNDSRGDASAWREGIDGSDDADRTAAGESTVALVGLADTYATEIIVFEWVTSLVSTAGPAATLRAIAYYEEIGWIGSDVKTYLEDVLSGPDLDVNVDPSRDPNELTAEDHAESYEYIMKLDAVQRTIDDTEL
ncbi:flagella accessory C family protein [Halorubellus sp. JP-L1]|uniref:FlaD/FlaE family flagellar protein n=1 Tax=Halorubellus sp. JP-L1 TaxID=2715753 RepID=UPI00140E5597|nr:FlaD/FlaE family flagellar protein [Halorubellus sp. JP-L1]NHN41647.1 flagella accessory C family protein [Halorubellus sp. JP-L1]